MIFTLLYLEKGFPSPCGEVVMKLFMFFFTGAKSPKGVFVPLRGSGDETCFEVYFGKPNYC